MAKKKITMVLLTAMAMALSLGAATSVSASEGVDLLDEILERGEITVAMEGTWAPWTYHDENDELVGYDVEVAQLIADKLGVEVNFIEGEWDGLLAGLDAGRYDIMVNGVDITEERSEKYDFSTPYAYNRTAVIVTGDNDEIQSMEDLDGKTTANTISSTYAELAESYGAQVTGVDDLNQTFELLLSGRIDATLNAEVTFYDYIEEHPEADVKIAALTDDATEVAIPMRKGEETETLRTAIDEVLAELQESGELSALSEKYFGVDISTADGTADEEAAEEDTADTGEAAEEDAAPSAEEASALPQIYLRLGETEDRPSYEITLLDNEVSERFIRILQDQTRVIPLYVFDGSENTDVLQYYDIPDSYDVPDGEPQLVTSEKAGEVYYSAGRIMIFYQDAEIEGNYVKIGDTVTTEGLKDAVDSNPLDEWGNRRVTIGILE